MIKFRPAQLNDCGGDLSGDWYIYYRIAPNETEALKLIKIRSDINRIHTLKERREYGRAICNAINTKLKAGKDPRESLIPRSEVIPALRELIESKRAQLRHRTYQSYHYAVNKLEKFLSGKGTIYMEDLNRQLIRQFMDSMTSRNYKGYTVNGIRSYISSLFNLWADRQEEPPVNPFKGIPHSHEEIGRNVSFSESERLQLWEYLKTHNPELYLFTRFIFFTFIRPIELLRLRVGDIRPEMGEIIIQAHQSKNKRQQSVVIPDAFKEEIRAMNLESFPMDYALFSTNLKPGAKFRGRNMVTVDHTKVLRHLKMKPDLTLYSWKHTGVVVAYTSGIDVYSIMRQLRHHSLDQTMIYLKSLGLVKNEEFGKKMKG